MLILAIGSKHQKRHSIIPKIHLDFQPWIAIHFRVFGQHTKEEGRFSIILTCRCRLLPQSPAILWSEAMHTPTMQAIILGDEVISDVFKQRNPEGSNYSQCLIPRGETPAGTGTGLSIKGTPFNMREQNEIDTRGRSC